MTHIDVQFSEPLDSAIAANTANYALTGAGPDNTFGTSDDVSYALSANYGTGARTTTLTFTAPSTELVVGQYRLTLLASGLHDAAGNPLSGGIDQVFSLSVAAKSAIVSVEGNSADGPAAINVRPDGTAVMVYANNPTLGSGAWPQVMIGQYDSGASTSRPYVSAPTDISGSFRAENPDVTVSPAGGVVVYSDYEEIIIGEPDLFEMAYQLLDASGRPIGSRQSAAYAYGGRNPRVDMNASGSFVVVYPTKDYTTHYVWDVRARLFGPDGKAASAIFSVNQQADATSPVVAYANDGTVIFAWVRGGAIYARRFDASGNPLGDEYAVSPSPGSVQSSPEIAVAADGSFVVAWLDAPGPGNSSGGVFFRHFDSAGSQLGGEVRVSPMLSTGGCLSIGVAPDGRFVIAYSLASGVFARRLAADGSFVGGPSWVDQGAPPGSGPVRVAVAADGDFVVRWANSVGSDSARWIAWDAPADVLPYGPVVRALPPLLTTASMSQMTVTFDRAMDAATFTPADVHIIDPVGRAVSATSVAPIDDRTFAIGFPTQHVYGAYTITIGPAISDTTGRPMGQDGDAIDGEASDAYQANVTLISPAPAPTPLLIEGFEAGSIDALEPYWSFARTAGSISVGTACPHSGGAYALQMVGPAAPPYDQYQEAILHLNLLGQSHVTLDFWHTVYNSGGFLEIAVSISSDGSIWKDLLTQSATAYAHQAFDLDAQGVAYTADTQIRFRHTDFSSYAWDDIRVAENIDVFGARVVAQTPTGTVSGPVSSFSVTFNEPIPSLASMVTVLGPGGDNVPLSPTNPIVDSGDHKTFTINLAMPQALAGHYAVNISADVLDISGNRMDQNGDGLQGDGYSGGFDIAAAPVSVYPFTEGFEAGSLGALGPYWSFARTAGSISVGTACPRSGGTYALQMTGPAAPPYGQYEDAILHLNLLGRSQVDPRLVGQAV